MATPPPPTAGQSSAAWLLATLPKRPEGPPGRESKMTRPITTPDFSLAGKVVLVTGAARGIGRACALAAAGAGAEVIVGLRDPAGGQELVGELQEKGRRAMAVKMDLADLPTVRAGLAEAHEAFGRIDVLVNNVGIGPENLAEDVTEEDFDLTVESTSRAPSSPPRRSAV